MLNPTDREDRGYLVDLPADQQLGPDENWFAVFMRVENTTDKAEPATNGYSIRDTQGNATSRSRWGPKNVFAYRAAVLRPKDVLPLPGQRGSENPIQGAMLLFKIPVANFQNRPLVLRIPPPNGGARPAPSTSTSSCAFLRRGRCCGALTQHRGRGPTRLTENRHHAARRPHVSLRRSSREADVRRTNQAPATANSRPPR